MARTLRSGILLAVGLILLVLFSIFLYVGGTFYQRTNPLTPYVPKSNDVTFAYSYYFNQTFGAQSSYDFRIGITLHYNGTLVAEIPIRVTANASEHTSESYNATGIGVRFQDSLAYPKYRVDFQNVPVDGSIGLMRNGTHFLSGTDQIYFPLAGTYSPIFTVSLNETIKGTHQNQTHILLPRLVNDISVLVQPPSRIDDEKIANDNLKLTFGLYVFDIITLGAASATAFKEGLKHGRDDSKEDVNQSTLIVSREEGKESEREKPSDSETERRLELIKIILILGGFLGVILPLQGLQQPQTQMYASLKDGLTMFFILFVVGALLSYSSISLRQSEKKVRYMITLFSAAFAGLLTITLALPVTDAAIAAAVLAKSAWGIESAYIVAVVLFVAILPTFFYLLTKALDYSFWGSPKSRTVDRPIKS